MCWKDKFLLETLRFGEFYFTAWWCACVEGRVLILGLCWDQLQFYLSTWFLFLFFRSPDDERSWCCARSPSAGCSLIRSNSTIKKFHSTWFHQKRFYLTLDFFFFFSGGGETGRLYRNHLSLKNELRGNQWDWTRQKNKPAEKTLTQHTPMRLPTARYCWLIKLIQQRQTLPNVWIWGEEKRNKQPLKLNETVLTSVIQIVLYSGLKPLILSQNKAVGSRHTKVQLSWAICAFMFFFKKDMKLLFPLRTRWINIQFIPIRLASPGLTIEIRVLLFFFLFKEEKTKMTTTNHFLDITRFAEH